MPDGLNLALGPPVEHHFTLLHVPDGHPQLHAGYGWICPCGARSYGWPDEAGARRSWQFHVDHPPTSQSVDRPRPTRDDLAAALRETLAAHPRGRWLTYRGRYELADAAAQTVLDLFDGRRPHP